MTTKRNKAATAETVEHEDAPTSEDFDFATGVRADGHGISRQLDTVLTEAEGELEHYIDVATMRPTPVVNTESLAKDKLAAMGIQRPTPTQLSRAVPRVQALFKERACNEMTRLADRVYLDLDGAHGDKAWLANDVPAICFAGLEETDSLWVKGKRQAVAIYLDTSLLPARYSKNKRTGAWQQRPDVYSHAGYLHIVRTFASDEAAVEAAERLAHSVFVIASSRTATDEEPEPAGWTGLDEDWQSF